ncbi:hypothetical protein Tco_1042401 [Tanacetum coccineum]|uniref:Uncharacterized protein n=1 Tax=Tanacetum coccineum TaxID=301880 RepID=A0ABQ5GJ01_9ASTR
MEVLGRLLGDVGTSAFKKVASMFGKFMFFKVGHAPSVGTRQLATWRTKIKDDLVSDDSDSDQDTNEASSVLGDISGTEDDTDDLNNPLEGNVDKNTQNVHLDENENNNSENVPLDENEEKKSDNDVYVVQETEEYTDHVVKDIHGFSLVYEISKLIEVGGALGYDIRGWRRALEKMIPGLIEIPMAIVLDRLWSDHNLILLHADKTDFGPNPFKVFESWMQMPGFDIMIKESYDEFNNLNSGLSSSLHKRLKHLKQCNKIWRHASKEQDNTRFQIIQAKLNELDIKIESSTTFDEDRNYRLQLMKERDDIYMYTARDISQKLKFVGM